MPDVIYPVLSNDMPIYIDNRQVWVQVTSIVHGEEKISIIARVLYSDKNGSVESRYIEVNITDNIKKAIKEAIEND